MAGRRGFTATLGADRARRVFVPVPFDPNEVWGRKFEHDVHDTVNGTGVRGVIELLGDGHGVVLGPAWRKDCGLAAGDTVAVALEPEGAQRDDLAEELAAALAAKPEAGESFDSIAQFYRRAYLRYIDATKRRPDERAKRIADVVGLLAKASNNARVHDGERNRRPGLWVRQAPNVSAERRPTQDADRCRTMLLCLVKGQFATVLANQ